MEEYEAEHCMWDWDEMPLDRKCVDGPVSKIVLHGSHWLNPGVTKKIDISDCKIWNDVYRLIDEAIPELIKEKDKEHFLSMGRSAYITGIDNAGNLLLEGLDRLEHLLLVFEKNNF